MATTVKRMATTVKRTSAPYELSDAAQKVDATLCAMDNEIDWLSRLMPNNIDDMWQGFVASSYKKMPPQTYDEIDIDLDALHKKLHNLPVHDIDDPLIEMLLIEKQRELGQQLELIRHRGTEGIIMASVSLFGGVGAKMIERAEDILANAPSGTDQPADCDAEQFAAIAQDDLDWYRKQKPDFDFKVIIDEEPGGSLLTAGGNLHIAPDYMVARSRIDPLIQHEIGTHTLTRHNGRKQPLHVLRCGLPDYDALQEGIAVLSEYLCGNLPPGRLRMLAGRVIAADMAVREETPEDIFARLHEEYGFDKERAFDTAYRAVRGGGLTKDALYLKGLVELLAYLGHGGDFETLFIGKFALKQLPILEKLLDRGLLVKPDLLPRYLHNPKALERLDQVRSISVSEIYQESPSS